MIDTRPETGLSEALDRVKNLGEIRKSMRDGQNPAILDSLEDAYGLLKDRVSPKGFYKWVDVKWKADDLFLEGIPVDNPNVRKRLEGQSSAIIYLVTCGYDSREVKQAIGEDYALYHFSHYLGRELLFLTGQRLHKQILEKEGANIKRMVFLEKRPGWSGDVGSATLWDAAIINKLYPLIQDNPLGVGITEAGCLDPLFSLMGLMYSDSKEKKVWVKD